MTCNRCFDPMTNTKGPCVFSTTGLAPLERERGETEMKGHFFTTGGKLYKVTTPEIKKLLKSVTKGAAGVR